MQVKEKQNVKTFLPAFSGFYNTIWEFKDDDVLDNINCHRKENNLPAIEWDNMIINYENYENDVGRSLCENIKNVLCEYIENIEFENIYSPKTYNFSNDVINCIITPNIENIQNFIYNHKVEFKAYLKNKYTSCDGFLSYYSNQFENWGIDTEKFSKFNSHSLGSILQFIFNMQNIDPLDVYYDVMENIYEYDYIENINQCDNAVICDTCKKFIENDNILNDIEKYKRIVNKNPSKVLCYECLENI